MISGIGSKCNRHLQDIGIKSIEELQSAGVDLLTREFGSDMAHTLKKLSFGEDGSSVTKYTTPQVGDSRKTTAFYFVLKYFCLKII